MNTVPIWPVFVRPVMEFLSDGAVHSNREIYSATYDILQLDEEAHAEVLGSGESRAHNRAGWALTHVVKARWVERVARGRYRITDDGRKWLVANPEGFSDYATADSVLAPFWHTDTEEPTQTASTPVAVITPPVAPVTVDPIEQIEDAIAKVDTEVSNALLDRLRESDPGFFEDAVVRVLLAMGYGGSEQRGKRIGGTGDGGVDGVIDQDALGLDQIYVQAKRYAAGNNVGREAIQAFIGALHGFGASRGVFITSSDFTSGAAEYARAIPTRIVLINGQRLAALMIKHRVGVQVKQTYSVVEIDEDFFE